MRRGLVIATVLVLALIAVSAYWLSRSGAAVSYITAPVTRGTVARTVSSSGTVNPVLTIIVGSYVSGVIRDQYCDFNTKVRQGQLCAKIDPRPYQTVVDQAKADLGTAKAQLIKDQANLVYAKVTYERNTVLITTNAISHDVLDSSKNTYDQAQAQIEVDRATIAVKEAALEAAQVNLDYTNIISPVDGTVVSRNITIGQTIAASLQTPTLFLIATDLTRMQVDTNVSESDVGGLLEGSKASFTVEAYPNRQFAGTVLQFRQAPQTVQNVVTYDIIIGVDNPDLLLKPGMTATTRIVINQRNDVLRVPDQAVRFTPGGLGAATLGSDASRVFVLRDGAPAPVAIRIGLDDESYSEVLEGNLTAGDQVIVGERHAGAGGPAAPSGPRPIGLGR
ncbi:MAG TPA: efflux RND transporter periplasmic adaptor subunit [Xanthobacteraceae bacterium]|nr:efflux RND transporter periplasmic adaptor subunit [Xanthobacteraceae bacterium]